MKVKDKIKLIFILTNLIMKKNWKTSLAGLITVLPTVLGLFGVPLTAEIAHAIEVVGAALIGFLCKDMNVTGGTTPQTFEALKRVDK